MKRQVDAMDVQAVEGRASSAAASAVAADSLAAIRRQADLMEDTARKQLRAYICLSGSTVRVTKDRTIEARILVKNVGQTPAYSIRSWSLPLFDDYPLTNELEPPPPDLFDGAGILPPQGQGFVEVPPLVNVPIDTLERLAGLTFALYVFGEVSYADIYGKRHVLRFRLVFGGPAGVQTIANSDGSRIGELSMDKIGNEERNET
ncbi:MAG: hypothetical protein ACRYFU_21035 [Janthinobacterium lividum]